MSSKQKKPELICPCCGVARGEQAKQSLINLELECDRHQVKSFWLSKGWSIETAMSGSLRWACPSCLKRSIALKGKPWLQTWCDHTPYFAFFDVELNCEDCQNKFVFSASEQQFWYEKLQFWVQSRPKQCKNCRKIRSKVKQANIELQEQLKNCDRNNPIDLAEIARLYFNVNSHKKGSIFLRRAINLARKNNRERELEAFIQKHNLPLRD